MTGSEVERQFYLGLAGVRLWYAREPLPGAAPSPEFSFPPAQSRENFEAVASVAPNRAPAAVSRPKMASSAHPGTEQLARLQALMEPGSVADTSEYDGDSNKPKRPVEADASISPLPDLSDEAVPDLNLRVWSGERFALMANISSDASLRLQEALALNILKSLGEQHIQSFGPVCWPVFNNQLVPGSALSDLVPVLKGVFAGVRAKDLIVLGVSPDGTPFGERPWFSQAVPGSLAVQFGHSLTELAGNPPLKRELWRNLKPLITP